MDLSSFPTRPSLLSSSSGWRDRLQDASFRGVPFKVEEESAGTGRRVETHEYPNRDKPYTEDLGKITFRPSITAYVVGDDCFDQRDRLIDCAAEPTQFNGRSLVQIAQALAAPFGIEVVNSGAPSGVIPDVQPDHGETVIEVINKILGQQQALAYDDPHGRLVIGGIGSTRAHTALVLGENILSCDTEKSIRERFSVYQVAGQRAGNDDDFGEATTTALRARTEDAFIARYRPMYIRQTGQATGAGCIARADFEARQRAARTDETTYVVQGWRQGNGTLWQPNQRVIVFDPVCGFDNTELLVSEVTFTHDQNGTLTEIRVGPPDAYLPEPEAPGARKKKKARVQEDPF
ncbi:DNA circularization N-terminal domain-containing protein [Escherichia coli]